MLVTSFLDAGFFPPPLTTAYYVGSGLCVRLRLSVYYPIGHITWGWLATHKVPTYAQTKCDSDERLPVLLDIPLLSIYINASLLIVG